MRGVALPSYILSAHYFSSGSYHLLGYLLLKTMEIRTKRENLQKVANIKHLNFAFC